uniref:Thioredoxin domain-containing protein n=1 Tax=Phaeocystis antarctica TaxID=33657 RepID=A0A7S0HDX9_9EUKA
MLDTIWSFLAANPLLVLAVCFMVYKQWQAKQPWPDFGGTIVSLKSVDEWHDTLSKADAAGKVVVVDAYATWCPPCKAAAPVYAKMSEEYTAESCVFTKFNTDEVGGMRSLLEISAMPTFKVFKAKAEVGCQRGWDESQVRALIEQHGAKKVVQRGKAD